MSKFVNIGMTMDQFFALDLADGVPRAGCDDLGHLTVGAIADVAVLRLENGQFGYIDVEGKRLRGNKRISAELTIKGGQVVWDRNGLSHEDWDKR